ncbi:MAG: hypothetical protein P9L95_01805, partial [Candidatus Tenebribacter mawsonii]|nr:hypothetical protein [Candidatus Tenebribacter mawsonii]
WQMLSLSSDKYIYDAVKFGVPQKKDIFADLPEEIKKGFRSDIENKIVTDSEETHLFEIRKVWNKKAPADIALPTEIYRELIERRKRYTEVKAKIENGEITQINDFITYNLNIRQFIQDIIADTDDPFLIKHFYDAIKKVTILDPTCGSGAFLFAALNILEPLYEGCLSRMQQFAEENPNKYKKFEEILADVNSPKHPNLQYFIYKSIILNNLFGVDIMNEAVEIAKLRLFLKLVSTADVDYKKDNYGLEPLPDIDFNIRCGNTLVGFASESEFKKAVEAIEPLFAPDIIKDFEDEFNVIAKAFKRFQDVQLIPNLGEESHTKAKSELQKRLKNINDKLNEYLSSNYGISDRKSQKKKYDNWLDTHQPFHWFSEFYEIMSKGGFDVVIGNPPYVEYSKVKRIYSIIDYDTINCGNIYANVIERNHSILKSNSKQAMIVQLPIVCTDRMKPIQDFLVQNYSQHWYATFDDRPGKLFEGLEHIRATILIAEKNTTPKSKTYTTTYNRWYSETRKWLFDLQIYENNNISVIEGAIPKIGHQFSTQILDKMLEKKSFKYELRKSTNNCCYFHNAPQYFIRVTTFTPYFWNEKDGNKVSVQIKQLNFDSKNKIPMFCSSLNSNLFYWWFILLSDCRHLNMREINNFPLSNDNAKFTVFNKLNDLLMQDYKNKSYRKQCYYKTTGKVEYDEYYPKKSKHIIDEIDKVLAQHYGFTEEELDFIINYDIKYRMGKELEAYVDGKL